MLLAQSFAKNFGLYGERVGTLSVVCNTVEQTERVMSQLKLVVRPMYSSPPIHGALIVKEVLSDETLLAQYYTECKAMADRILDMRSLLKEKLLAAGSSHDWDHVTDQIGMFAFTGTLASHVHVPCTLWTPGGGRTHAVGCSGALRGSPVRACFDPPYRALVTSQV